MYIEVIVFNFCRTGYLSVIARKVLLTLCLTLCMLENHGGKAASSLTFSKVVSQLVAYWPNVELIYKLFSHFIDFSFNILKETG